MTENKKKLAEFLKEKRQNKNLSLDRLSELTKIQVYYLEAMENGQFEKLPPSVYRTGIFKRLSKFLEIGENEIIKIYDEEFQTNETPLNIIASSKKSRFILTPRKLVIFSGAFLLILLSAYLWYQFNFLIGPPNLAIDPREDMIVNQASLSVKGKTDSGVSLTINGESIYVSPDGNFSKDIQLAAGVNIIELKAINSFGKTTKIIRQIFKQ